MKVLSELQTSQRIKEVEKTQFSRYIYVNYFASNVCLQQYDPDFNFLTTVFLQKTSLFAEIY